MSLRKQTGNMYSFVTHTWNPIKGRCPHECAYCYMRRFPLGPPHLDEKELRADLGSGNFIFVGSGTDMWAEEVPEHWIVDAINACRGYPQNTYLFQSKNPLRFYDFLEMYDCLDTVFGTTIETNRIYPQMGKTPCPEARSEALRRLHGMKLRTMLTIEPIMDFDTADLAEMVWYASPEWVNIGADSKRSGLPEPSREKTLELIAALKEFTTVKIKSNLERIIGKEVTP